MMSNLRETTPKHYSGRLISNSITLASLKHGSPQAYKTLLHMNNECMQVLLLWLNGLSTSPVSYNIADRELTKEDARSSALRNRYHIKFSSTKCGRRSKHYMTREQIECFLDDPQSMKSAVKKEVETARLERDKRKLNKMATKRGLTWIKEELKVINPEKAANDNLY